MSKTDEKAVSCLEQETGLDLSWGEATFEEDKASMAVRGYLTDNIFVATYVCWIEDGEAFENVSSKEVLDLIKKSKSA